MDKKTRDKLSKLDPKLRNKLEEILGSLLDSISSLYEEATRDHKTGAYNTRFFENVLDIEIEQSKRGVRPLSMIIFDLDKFKKLNDTHGHVVGDEILIRFAELLRNKSRKSDIVARFGGEEFIVLLPETDLKKAEGFADRFRKIVKADKKLKKYNVTVSAGISEFKKKETKRTFKSRTDKALYKAKDRGRDQVVSL